MSKPLRIKISADEDTSFTVMFEPLGMDYDLGPGEWMYAEVQAMEAAEMEIIQWEGGMSILPPGTVRTFNAAGEFLHELHN
ncbi:hypothetical protein QLQ12_07380 [Actinoplanes sp. NEAU-A12]|uniref:Uncharacterized protein n=1 Tax=Actinoplanes sandaracinus TaxID=3045177 RepID=A0ABT6WFD4_9ACTN|nr:hypothetical protein [Actinoplanes sandaracinus]MDI6098422.1 hypothetical protein [Actinoplanes sandaracinus]